MFERARVTRRALKGEKRLCNNKFGKYCVPVLTQTFISPEFTICRVTQKTVHQGVEDPNALPSGSIGAPEKYLENGQAREWILKSPVMERCRDDLCKFSDCKMPARSKGVCHKHATKMFLDRPLLRIQKPRILTRRVLVISKLIRHPLVNIKPLASARLQDVIKKPKKGSQCRALARILP